MDTLEAVPSTDEYLTLAEAVRVSGRSAAQIKNLAACRQIAVDGAIGCRLTYRRADVERARIGRPEAVAC